MFLQAYFIIEVTAYSLLVAELLSHTLFFLDDEALQVASCVTEYLLTFCDQARLRHFLSQLSPEQKGLKGRLSADVHISRRLCPPGFGTAVLGKSVKSAEQALARLSRVTKPGDKTVISGLLPFVRYGSPSTRAAAVRAVCKLSSRGDREVLDAVLGQLCDPSAGCSLDAVLDGLRHLAIPSDPYITSRVYALLEHKATRIRSSALKALPVLVKRGDEQAIRLILAQVEDKESEIREVAMQALGIVADDGHEQALTRLISGLRDESIYVRSAACEAINNIALTCP